MFHYRKTRKVYTGFPKPEVCNFCDPETLANAVYETEHAYIVPNRVFYDVWELRDVADHLLVVPKRHVKSLSQLNTPERAAIMDVISDYEGRDYNIYARSVDSKQRSVAHQHTHLIKTTEAKRKPRALIFTRKPYFLIKF